MVHSGKVPVKRIERPAESHRETEIKEVSDKIEAIERKCNEDGFDSQVVEDVGGMLTFGVCARSGINLDAERLGVSLLDEDRRSIELDMADKIRSKSSYLIRAAEEVLGPFSQDAGKGSALAYWATLSRRLESRSLGNAERKWLAEEEEKQDGVLIRGAGVGFKAVMEKNVRKRLLGVFSGIRRAGNRVPVLGRLFKFG